MSANTKAKAVEANANWDFVNYADIANNKKIQWRDQFGDLSTYINESLSGTLNISVAEDKTISFDEEGSPRIKIENVTETFILRNGYQLIVNDTLNQDNVIIKHDGTHGIITTKDTLGKVKLMLSSLDSTAGPVMQTLAGDPIGAKSENGMIYYNTTSHKFRGYVNGSWVNLH